MILKVRRKLRVDWLVSSWTLPYVADGMAELLQKRRLPDDVLEYLLIPQLPEGLGEKDVVSFLEGLCDTYLGYLGPLVIDYIWQNEGFTLRPVAAKGEFQKSWSAVPEAAFPQKLLILNNDSL